MEHHKTITQAHGYTIPELTDMYNEAVGTILMQEEEIKELNTELDLWQQAYEELSAELYG